MRIPTVTSTREVPDRGMPTMKTGRVRFDSEAPPGLQERTGELLFQRLREISFFVGPKHDALVGEKLPTQLVSLSAMAKGGRVVSPALEDR